MNRRTLFGTLTAGLAGLLVPAAAQADSMEALVAFVKAEARRERVSVLPVRQLKEYSAELTVDVSEEGATWKLHLWKGAEQFYFTVVRNRRGVKAVIPEFYEQLGVWCGQTSETLVTKSTDVETFGNQFRDFRYHSPSYGLYVIYEGIPSRPLG